MIPTRRLFLAGAGLLASGLPARAAPDPRKPVPALASPDLRDLVRRSTRGRGGAARGDLLAFYEARGFAPAWTRDGLWTDAARALIARLRGAADDGLAPETYLRASFAHGPAERPSGPPAQADLELSSALAAYARDASGGRLDMRRLGAFAHAEPEIADVAPTLARLAASAEPLADVEALHPPHAGYAALKAAFGRARAAGDAATAALAAFNMERWRWLPRDLGALHVKVNIPEFVVRVVREGAVAYEGRAVVGTRETPTPAFSGTMTYFVVNPSWTVPPGIARRDFFPLLASNPEALARRGIEVVRRGRATTFRQPPGERNALGRIKFMFPNRYSIYLHDTPARGYFQRPVRAFSNGCVRVEDPLAFADAAFAREANMDGRRIRAMYGGPERGVRLAHRLPVHLAYFTAEADAEGRLRRHADVYGLDRRMRDLMAV